MLLKQMEYFISVIDNNSFTEAAQQCYISQSAISQQIKALEDDLGVPLLIRSNRTFKVTPAGEYFYRQSKILLDEANRLKRDTISIGDNVDYSLTIGYLYSYKGQELQHAIAVFSSENPDVDIKVKSGNHEELYELLRNDQADILLSDQRRAFSKGFLNKHLLTSDCYVELSSNSTLSSLDTITISELSKVPCIIVASTNQRENEQAYYQDTLRHQGSFIFVETIEEARLLVAGNKGFLIVEELGSAPIVSTAIVRIPLYINGSVMTKTFCAYAKEDNVNPYIKQFVDILDKMFPDSSI